MPGVELKKPLKLDDLEVGKIFDENELIIDSDKKSMTTIRSDEGWDPSLGEYDMRIFMYDIIADEKGNIIKINNNGYGEIYLKDENHEQYKSMLQESNLCG